MRVIRDVAVTPEAIARRKAERASAFTGPMSPYREREADARPIFFFASPTRTARELRGNALSTLCTSFPGGCLGGGLRGVALPLSS